MAYEIKNITDSYNVTDKVLILVSDNASNVTKATEILNCAIDKLKWKHFPCYAHTLNLVVQNAVKAIQPLLEKGRHIVTFFKRSNLASEKLQKFQKDSGFSQPKKLIQDVQTRWNSTYFMVDRLTLLRDAVKTSLTISERDYINLSPEEWNICSEMVKVLKPFQDVTQKMSGEGYVTGSQVIVLTSGLLHVCKLLKQQPYQKIVLQVVADLEEGFLKRFQNIELHRNAAICAFLDPRFKLFAFTSDHSRNSSKKVVTELVVKEYNEIKKSQEK